MRYNFRAKLRKEADSMEKHLQTADRIISDATNAFLKQINAICENGPFRKARKLPSTFSIFRGTNDEVYEYAYFERIATGKMKGKTSDSDDERNTLNYYKLLIDVQTDEDVRRANAQNRCEYKRGDHGMI
mgnify:CR=1 FL=1